MMKRNSICAAALCLVLMLPACLLAEDHVFLFKETQLSHMVNRL